MLLTHIPVVTSVEQAGAVVYLLNRGDKYPEQHEGGYYYRQELVTSCRVNLSLHQTLFDAFTVGQSYLFVEPRTKTQDSSCLCFVFLCGSFYSIQTEDCCWVWEQELGTEKKRITPNYIINWSELLHNSWKPYSAYQKFEEYY